MALAIPEASMAVVAMALPTENALVVGAHAVDMGARIILLVRVMARLEAAGSPPAIPLPVKSLGDGCGVESSSVGVNAGVSTCRGAEYLTALDAVGATFTGHPSCHSLAS